MLGELGRLLAALGGRLADVGHAVEIYAWWRREGRRGDAFNTGEVR